jgi:hypothetical protein
MLVQMLIVLGLMGAFVIVADRVYRLSVTTAAKAAREQEDLIRLEQAMSALRTDVWRAAKLETPDPTTLRAGNVVWDTLYDGELLRSQADDQQEWSDLKLEFERQGSLIIVRRRGVEIALLRQAPPAVKDGAK